MTQQPNHNYQPFNQQTAQHVNAPYQGNDGGGFDIGRAGEKLVRATKKTVSTGLKVALVLAGILVLLASILIGVIIHYSNHLAEVETGTDYVAGMQCTYHDYNNYKVINDSPFAKGPAGWVQWNKTGDWYPIDMDGNISNTPSEVDAHAHDAICDR